MASQAMSVRRRSIATWVSCLVLNAVRPSPQDLARRQRTSGPPAGFGSSTTSHSSMSCSRERRPPTCCREPLVRRRRSDARSHARGTFGVANRRRSVPGARDGSAAGARPACATSRRHPSSALAYVLLSEGESILPCARLRCPSGMLRTEEAAHSCHGLARSLSPIPERAHLYVHAAVAQLPVRGKMSTPLGGLCPGGRDAPAPRPVGEHRCD